MAHVQSIGLWVLAGLGPFHNCSSGVPGNDLDSRVF